MMKVVHFSPPIPLPHSLIRTYDLLAKKHRIFFGILTCFRLRAWPSQRRRSLASSPASNLTSPSSRHSPRASTSPSKTPSSLRRSRPTASSWVPSRPQSPSSTSDDTIPAEDPVIGAVGPVNVAEPVQHVAAGDQAPIGRGEPAVAADSHDEEPAILPNGLDGIGEPIEQVVAGVSSCRKRCRLCRCCRRST
ncbi:hypothetical protein BC829DRAFT_65475 [Chytridium lagenaria]|nr:hypothetical protein BC829DRAFT_65475 [Chytridium lagenaria]